jgi:peptide/nickel transport system substrate-binding protein
MTDRSRKKNKMILFIILGAVALMMISIPLLWAESKEASTTEWKWTKENPKPSWWKWDESYYPSKPVRGGYFQSASVRYVGLMNPNHWPVNDFAALNAIYDRLIFIDGEYRPIIPWLATSWTFEDPVTVLMTLRPGVKYHDGTTFNAESLKFQVDWNMNPASGTWSRGWIKPLKSIDVVDEYTVRWHLKQPWAGFLDIYANVPGWMMSAQALNADAIMDKAEELNDELYAAKKKDLTEEEKATLADLEKRAKAAEELAGSVRSLDEWAVGTGPMMVEDARPGNYLKLKRNPDWWFGKTIGKPDMPYVDGRKITVIPEQSVQLANLKAGKIDSLVIDPAQYAQVKDDPKLNVRITPVNFTLYLTFNHKNGPCKDIRVRKAISHAIDRKAAIAAASGGFGRVASCLFPPEHWAHNPNLKPVETNVELSKKLLAEAGYANGLTIRGPSYSDNSAVRFNQIVKAMLKRVNIDWKVETLDPVSMADKLRNHEYDIYTNVAQYIKDPDSTTRTWYDPEADGNLGRSHNKEAVRLMVEARQEYDFEKRKQLYHGVEKALYDNYEDAWLWHFTGISATRKQWLGYNREMQLEGGEAYWPTHPGWFKDGKRN